MHSIATEKSATQCVIVNRISQRETAAQIADIFQVGTFCRRERSVN